MKLDLLVMCICLGHHNVLAQAHKQSIDSIDFVCESVLTYFVFLWRLFHRIDLISKGLVLNLLSVVEMVGFNPMSIMYLIKEQLTWVLRDCPDWWASSVACLETTINFWLRELTSYKIIYYYDVNIRAFYKDHNYLLVLTSILSHHNLKFSCGILLDVHHIVSCEPITNNNKI